MTSVLDRLGYEIVTDSSIVHHPVPGAGPTVALDSKDSIFDVRYSRPSGIHAVQVTLASPTWFTQGFLTLDDAIAFRDKLNAAIGDMQAESEPQAQPAPIGLFAKSNDTTPHRRPRAPRRQS